MNPTASYEIARGKMSREELFMRYAISLNIGNKFEKLVIVDNTANGDN